MPGIRYTSQFGKDVAAFRGAGHAFVALKRVIRAMAADETLLSCRTGVRECPIGPDLVLVYYASPRCVTLVRLLRAAPRPAPSNFSEPGAIIMWTSYVRIFLRNLKRHVGYSAINVAGLAVGMACFLLIMLFVREQLSFDRFHERADDVYRVLRTYEDGTGAVKSGSTQPYLLGDLLVDDYPEVEQTVRMLSERQKLVRREGAATRESYEEGVKLTEPSFFDVFSFPLLRGDRETVLTRPDGIVLTERMVQKYFGDEDPMGQTLEIDNQYPVEVTGVVADPPLTSSIQFDFLASLDAPYGRRVAVKRFIQSEWQAAMYATFVRLRHGTDVGGFLADLPDEVTAKAPVDVGYFLKTRSGAPALFDLDPLTDTYLFSDALNGLGPRGDLRYVIIFATVAFLILLVAAINYMNLSTARALRRAREVGIRKVVGAHRGQLSRQFLAEAMLLCLMALPLALLMVEAVLPAFNGLVHAGIALHLTRDRELLLGLLGLVLLLGLASGSYPALVLSRFRPIEVLKGTLVPGRGGARLRQGLVVFQFAISVALIVSTAIIQHQLDYVHTTKLGLQADQMLVVPLGNTPAAKQSDALKQAAVQIGGVQEATLSSMVPTRSAAGSIRMADAKKNDLEHITSLSVDDDFLDTYAIAMADGRDFKQVESTSEDVKPVLVNATAAKALAALGRGVIGSRFRLAYSDVEVIGVMRDFHLESLHDVIEPTMLLSAGDSPAGMRYLSLKLDAGELQATMDALRAAWKEIAPDHPFDYFFLDDAFDQLYRTEDRLGNIFNAFTLIVIFIACLGLFGLAAYTAELRTREIGIRKVLGASVGGIVVLLSRDFVKLVLIAFVVAAPLAYFAVDRWLQGFAYRASVSWWIFVASGGAALGIALLTVAYQSIRAALTDPVETLRYE